MAEKKDVESRSTALEQVAGHVKGRASAARPVGATRPVDDALSALEGLRVRSPAGGVALYTVTVDLPPGDTVRWQHATPAAAVLDKDCSDYAPAPLTLGYPVRLQNQHAALHGAKTATALVEAVDTGTSGKIHHHRDTLASAGWLLLRMRGKHEVPPSHIVTLPAIVMAAGTAG